VYSILENQGFAIFQILAAKFVQNKKLMQPNERENFYLSNGASRIFLSLLELEIIIFEDFKKFKFEIAMVGLAAPGNLGKTHKTLLIKCTFNRKKIAPILFYSGQARSEANLTGLFSYFHCKRRLEHSQWISLQIFRIVVTCELMR